MSDLEQRLTKRKTQTVTGRKLDLMNAVLLDKRIDYYSKAVFNDLIRYRHAITGLCFPSDDTIAADIGGTRKRVVVARRALRKYGYIDWINPTLRTGREMHARLNGTPASDLRAAFHEASDSR
jgi:hypothetical protein